MPELTQLLSGKSMILSFPANGTAGFARHCVSCFSRAPRPRRAPTQTCASSGARRRRRGAWLTGLKDYAYPSAYFKLENFFSLDKKCFYATIGSDIYGGWRFDYAKSRAELDPPIAVDDALCHRLDKLEDVVAAEWLIFGDDERFEPEKAAYAADHLPAGEVLVRHHKLAKFDRDKPVWTFYSHGFNDEVLQYMTPRWPLDYGAE